MTDQPNVVLVTVDSLRADHCSFMGYERETTPALDGLAADGLVFENAVAPGPSTPESMPAVFTGGHAVNGTGDGGIDTVRDRIRHHMAVRETLAEKLSRRGYATAAFTPNPFTSRFFGFGRGFDHFQDFMGSVVRRKYGRLFQRFFKVNEVTSLLRLLGNFWQRQEVFKPWEAYYEDAVDWTRTADRPYFLWLHLMDPHIPYLPPRAYRSQRGWETYYANYRFWRENKESAFDPTLHERLVTAYDDSIRYVDAFFERLRADVDSETVVVVHGDHGEAFGEHGTYGHEPYLYEENIHVPFVVSPARSRVIETPVSLCRLPTLLARLADGRGMGPPDTPFAVSRTRRGRKTALRGRQLKYIDNESDGELYNLARDEQTRLTDHRLRETCEGWMRTITASERERQEIRGAAQELVRDDESVLLRS